MKQIVLLIVAGLCAGALADQVDNREATQEKRIEQGVESGSLTPGETKRLENGQRRVDAAEAKAKADGVVTPEEARKLQKMQNRQSRGIRRAKGNFRR